MNRTTKASNRMAASRVAALSHRMLLHSLRPIASALAMTPTLSGKQGSITPDLTLA